MAEIVTALAPLVERINNIMTALIARDEEIVARIGAYSFEGGGKRLRPVMFCLVTEALGAPLTDERVEIAASFEFLHMATLLHDDIVDLSELRRGQASAHLVFGVPEAVLAGDYLLSKAAALGAETDSLECVRAMAGVVAALSLGELVQLNSRRRTELPEPEYFTIIFRKTAVLMEGSTRTAAILAGADEPLKAAAANYGRLLGLAFQIMDDILDYQSDRETFGKPVGHDLSEGKITLPFIRAREALRGDRRARLCELAGQEIIGPEDYAEIGRLVAEGGGVESARVKAEELAREAAAALAVFPPSPARSQLEALAEYTVARKN
ncbi:MAG: polyprenyl synthetase family protein [Candidatus Adiutrix sp.]|jgi:octaprenyl-diphosphate synthase|nr:polyprenyl synthetase family protein [Candidatus Adiutrix sp.]